MKTTLFIAASLTLTLILSCKPKGERGFVGEPISVVAEISEEDGELDFEWEIVEQPDASFITSADLEPIADGSEIIFTPDAEGKYQLQVTIYQYGDELSTQSFSYVIEPGEEYLEELYDETEDYEEAAEETTETYADEDDSWLQEEVGEPIPVTTETTDAVTPTPATIPEEKPAPPPPPKPEALPKKTARPAPGSSIPYDKDRFTIQVAAKKKLQDAEQIAADLIEAGFDAYIQKAYFKETNELWYRVRVGSYDNRDTARAVAESIANLRNSPTWVDYVRYEH
jgi:cell division septation protein DedD